LNIEFLLTALIVVLAPGTGVIYTVGTGLSQGTRAAIAASFGCTLGIIPHLLAATLGLAAILHTSTLLFQAVKCAGVIFLLYLAWQTLQTQNPPLIKEGQTKNTLIKVTVKGGLINILNPKLSIFFLAFLPQFLTGNIITATSEMILLGTIFMVITFIVFIGYGIFASVVRKRILQNPNVLKWAHRVFAATFAGLAVKLATERQ